LPIFGGAFGWKPGLFSFNTAATEGEVGALVLDSRLHPFTADDLLQSGKPDVWQWLAREVAVFDDVKTRFDATLALVDDTAKVLAMFAASYGVKTLVPNVSLSKLEQGSSEYWAALEQKAAGRNRVLIMTTMFAGLNLAMSYIPTTPLDPKTGKPNRFWMSPEMKASFMQVFASDSRIVSNIFGNVGKWRDDLVFEFIFDVLRYTVDIGIMSMVFGASLKLGNTVIVDNSRFPTPAFANAIYLAQRAMRWPEYASQVPTYSALDALEASTSNSVDDAKAAHGFISDFNYYLAIGNGLNGALGIQQGIQSATGTSIEVGASILGGLGARSEPWSGVCTPLNRVKRSAGPSGRRTPMTCVICSTTFRRSGPTRIKSITMPSRRIPTIRRSQVERNRFPSRVEREECGLRLPCSQSPRSPRARTPCTDRSVHFPALSRRTDRPTVLQAT
jgi:hypothetical protein